MSTTQPPPLSPDADIVIDEYGATEPLEGEQFPQRAQQVVENEINKGDDDRLRIEWLADGRVKLHATSYVGIITLPGGLTIEIRPKVDDTDLLSVLQYSQGIRAETIDEETSITRGNEFIHALATLFESELADVIQRGLTSEYRRHADTEDHVRGRIAVQRQLQRHGPQPTQFECNYDTLTQNTVLNQSILYATDILLRFVEDRTVSSRLQRHRQVLQRSTDLRPVRLVELEAIELSRLADYYADLFRLTKFVLRGIYADELSAGSRASFSLLVNMNEIFESVLERGLSELYSATSVTIQSQVTNNELFQNGSRPISIRPDILAEGGEEPLFVGDAKWKEDDPQSREPSTGDLYQILSYQVAYDVPGVLFYPAQAGKVASVYDSQFDHDIYLVEIPTTAAERLSYADTVESTLIEELPPAAIPE
jgi:5-methylcytosine-specific restriction enzyme subunit McrC